MPCATTHLHLADRVLSEWRRHPDRSPLRLTLGGVNGSDPVRLAFLHGSLAPDMGFVPGTHRLISELAHYVTPVTLTRALLVEARTPEEVAFAWGWASHVLGDVVLHPLVGRAVGERVRGDRSVRMDAAEDVQTHVSLEVGLDMTLLGKSPISPPPADTFFHSRSIAFLGRALEGCYGVGWDGPILLRSHRRAVGLTRWWPRTLGILARGRWGRGPGRWGLGPPLETARRLVSAGSPIRGFLGPIQPQPWVVSEVMERAHAFPDDFQRWVDGGLAGVPDLNLETGEVAGAGRGHPASDEALRKLDALRGEESGALGP
ncbi:MAG: hypothetical protein EA351_15360 [Gemmatimonadales bacterium]|nr:MAG: hypothetical protein EA351_15360 [Gemmatimonadales bacterium]